jgi:hypothetical protein
MLTTHLLCSIHATTPSQSDLPHKILVTWGRSRYNTFERSGLWASRHAVLLCSLTRGSRNLYILQGRSGSGRLWNCKTGRQCSEMGTCLDCTAQLETILKGGAPNCILHHILRQWLKKRRMKCAGRVARMRNMRNPYTLVVKDRKRICQL